MNRKLFQNYYSKIIMVCIVITFGLVSLISSIVLYAMNNRRMISEIEMYDKAMSEIEQFYEDIIEDRFLAYVPFYSAKNAEIIQKVCSGEYVGYSSVSIESDFERILSEVCQNDNRIEGVYFKRCVDDVSYLYSVEDKKLRKTSLALEYIEMQQMYFSLIGGRKMTGLVSASTKQGKSVFGIQSKLFSSAGILGTPDYQVTLLYSMDLFDSILEKYNISSETRFLVLSQQGLIIYDSWEEYNINQASWFENMDIISGNEDYFQKEQIRYMIKRRHIEKRDSVILCMIPESNIKNFRLSGTMRIVIVIAVSVNILVITLLLYLRKAISKKFAMLEKGIGQIGMINLKYRIPVEEQENEFSRIAVRFNKMCDDLNTMIDKNYVYQVLQQKAEYQALKTSVNPHFLYNSLESIREMLEERGQDEAADVVLMLSRIFDYQIHGESIATIWMELEALQNYIDFLSVRYRHAFDYSIDFDDAILDYKAPKQIFQPIMENYFEHAFKGDGTDFIHILGYLDDEDEMIHISFCDNGKGIREEHKRKINISLAYDEEHGGLSNVYKRLKILFGENCHVEIYSNTPEPGVSVLLVFEKKLMIDAQ